jgi:hypothetical protein
MRFLVTVAVYIFWIAGHCQSLTELESKMLMADSVLIVSHDGINGFFEDESGNAISNSSLLINGQLNYSIIHEKLQLQKKLVLKLSKIIIKPRRSFFESATCFKPHHSIVIVKNGNYSSIEFCFECHRVRATTDILFSDEDMDNKKWDDLKLFFKQNSFKYELE